MSGGAAAGRCETAAMLMQQLTYGAVRVRVCVCCVCVCVRVCVSAAQVSKKMVAMCVDRGASINHQNRQRCVERPGPVLGVTATTFTGPVSRVCVCARALHRNTALHYAMAYDPSGELGEYLIEKGADDTLENVFHLTPYDGLGGS